MGIGIERHGPVAWLTIQRPDKGNSIDPETHEALADTWPVLEQDPTIRVLVLTGQGDQCFSAGADIGTFLPFLSKAIKAHQDPLHFCGLTNRRLRKPLIAAINGDAFGGGLELALAVDLRIAVDHARFALPEVRIGAIAGAGGVTRLRRAVPAAVADYMILTGEPISAVRACEIGLVSEIVPSARLRHRVLEIASEIAAHPPAAIAACCDLRENHSLPLDAALKKERAAFRTLMASEELGKNLERFAHERTTMFRKNAEEKT